MVETQRLQCLTKTKMSTKMLVVDLIFYRDPNLIKKTVCQR